MNTFIFIYLNVIIFNFYLPVKPLLKTIQILDISTKKIYYTDEACFDLCQIKT